MFPAVHARNAHSYAKTSVDRVGNNKEKSTKQRSKATDPYKFGIDGRTIKRAHKYLQVSLVILDLPSVKYQSIGKLTDRKCTVE